MVKYLATGFGAFIVTYVLSRFVVGELFATVISLMAAIIVVAIVKDDK